MKIGLIRSPNTSHYTQTWRNDIGTYNGLGKHNRVFLPPLGIAMLKSYLENKGLKIRIDDVNIKVFYDPDISNGPEYPKAFLDGERIYRYLVKDSHDDYLTHVGETFIKKINFGLNDIDLFGISCEREKYEFLPALIILKLVKEYFDVPTALGGWQKGDLPTPILKLNFVDFICIDEGEYPLEGLARYLNNEQVRLEDIDGLAYKKEGGIRVNKPCYHQGKGFLPPDFDGLPLNLYKAGNYYKFMDDKGKRILILPFQFVRGCPNNCAFCKESTDKRWYCERPEDVAQGMEYLITKYKTNYFFFLNNEFNTTYKYASAVCDEILKADIEVYWTDCARFDNMSKELLQKMKSSGAVRLIWGLESGSPRISQMINKRIDLAASETILHLSHELEIWNGIEIIVGFPYETKEDLLYTIDYLERNKTYIDTVYLNHFILFTQATYGKNAAKYKIVIRTPPQNESLKNVILYDDYMGHPYDEIDGLPWEKKVKQTDDFFNLVNEHILPTQRAISFMDILVYRECLGGVTGEQ